MNIIIDRPGFNSNCKWEWSNLKYFIQNGNMLPHMYCAGDDLLLTELHGVDHCCLGSVFL